jgi:hypothetical protein
MDRVRLLEWLAKMAISLVRQIFCNQRWRTGTIHSAPKTDAFNLLCFWPGELYWEGADLTSGECWFMPASRRSYDLNPADESF